MASRTPTRTGHRSARQHLGPATHLTTLATGLAGVASAIGLLLPDVYRDNAWVVPQNRGTDLVTLVVAVPILLSIVPRARKGSARATVVWLALLGYLFYVYAGAAFAYAFNALFLVYVAIFSLAIAALVALAVAVPHLGLDTRFDARFPRRTVAVACATIAVLLTALWLAQIVPFFLDGEIPQAIRDAGGATSFVFVLDLGIVVPLAVLGALWTWRGALWGYLIGGYVLVKAATMGLALVAMSLFLATAGEPLDPGLFGVWIVLAVGAGGVAARYLRGIEPLS